MKNRMRLLGVLILALLAGCVSTYGRRLAERDRQVAAGRDVIVVVPQSVPGIKAVPSRLTSSTGGGAMVALLDVAIENHRVDEANTVVPPLRDAMADYDFNHEVLDAIDLADYQMPWLGVNKVTLTQDGSPENLTKLMDASTASQMMYDRVEYSFSSDFKTLYVDLKASILARKPASTSAESPRERMASGNALYYNEWIYKEPLAAATNEPGVNAKLWAEDHGVRVRGAVHKALKQLARNLVVDLYPS